MAALVLGDLAELGRREAVEPPLHLARGQLEFVAGPGPRRGLRLV